MRRLEYKYLVPNRLLEPLRAVLAPFTVTDPYALRHPGEGYTVRSVYLDTPTLRYYREKHEGNQIRYKLRVRTYNSPSPGDPAFLEIKRKNEQATWKDRASIPFERVSRVLDSRTESAKTAVIDGRPASGEAVKHFFFLTVCDHARPTCLVVYEREAFVGTLDPRLRITFDRNLRSRLVSSMNVMVRTGNLVGAFPDHFILEVKFIDRFPSWLHIVLAEHGLIRRSLSKYIIGMDTFAPDRLRRTRLPFYASPPAFWTGNCPYSPVHRPAKPHAF